MKQNVLKYILVKDNIITKYNKIIPNAQTNTLLSGFNTFAGAIIPLKLQTKQRKKNWKTFKTHKIEFFELEWIDFYIFGFSKSVYFVIEFKIEINRMNKKME